MKINLYTCFLVTFVNVKIFTMEADPSEQLGAVVSYVPTEKLNKYENFFSNNNLLPSSLCKLEGNRKGRYFKWDKFKDQTTPIYSSIPRPLLCMFSSYQYRISIPIKALFSKISLGVDANYCQSIVDILNTKQKEYDKIQDKKVFNELYNNIQKLLNDINDFSSEIIDERKRIQDTRNAEENTPISYFYDLYHVKMVFKNEYFKQYLVNVFKNIDIKSNNIILDLSFFIKKIQPPVQVCIGSKDVSIRF